MAISKPTSPVFSFFSKLKDKKYSKEILFSQYFPDAGQILSFRSLTPGDLKIIYEWVNLPYAKKFWKMNGPKENLLRAYEEVLDSKYEHSFLGIMDGTIICQWDLYQVLHDELGACYEAGEGDMGIHLLMSPRRSVEVRYLSLYVINAILRYLFSHPFIKKVVAEPDATNIKACQLLYRAGFSMEGNFRMTTKLASVFLMTEEQFSQASAEVIHSTQNKSIHYEKK